MKLFSFEKAVCACFLAALFLAASGCASTPRQPVTDIAHEGATQACAKVDPELNGACYAQAYAKIYSSAMDYRARVDAEHKEAIGRAAAIGAAQGWETGAYLGGQ